MRKKTKTVKAFTLIELLMVIAIIGILSSIVLVNLSGVKEKAKDAGALASATQIMKLIQICELDGGKVSVPGNAITGGGNMCNLGSSYGTWPKAPTGWSWYGAVLNGNNNAFGLCYPPTPDGSCGPPWSYFRYCGIVPDWEIYCSGYPNFPGLCRIAKTYTCTTSYDFGVTWK